MLRIIVSGSNGFIGSALVSLLQSNGLRISRLVRAQSQLNGDSVYWDPEKNIIDTDNLEGFDAVVHLAGENIAGKRWSTEQKRRLWESRVAGTTLLCRALASLNRKPSVLLSASAIGFYGDRGAEICTEDSAAGTGFLPELASAWEASAQSAQNAGIRVVHPRLGMVLAAHGGALKKMLPIFRAGLGGRLGSGRQYMSWIELGDLLRLLQLFIANNHVSGPVNCVAPSPVTNKEFTQTLASVVGKPALIPAPAFALRMVLGEMADGLLLSSTRVESNVLKKMEFKFACPSLESALRLHLTALNS